VPGLFSQAGRSTAFEIENLQSQLKLNPDEKPDDTENDEKRKKAPPKVSNLKARILKLQGPRANKGPEELEPRTPGGELARAIQGKLRTNQDEVSKDTNLNTSQNQVAQTTEHLTIPFSYEGKEGNFATKFTASYDIGSINHRNEQRPAPAQYQIRHESVLDRPPAWDFHLRQKHRPRSKPGSPHASDPLAFMTGLDLEDKDVIQGLTARQRAALKDAVGKPQEKPKQAGTMSLNSERGPLGQVGRIHVLANEISCAYDSDLLDQDIKGYPKLRYPRWDFDANSARQPLIKEDSLSEPGKYDYSLDCVKSIPKSGVSFDKALPRSVCVSTMGYSAPTANLHPEDKRTRGVLPNRSAAKDSVRHRITHVNDFDREMARPPLLTGGAQTFHDKNDPSACAAVYQREMSYDAVTADVVVTHRRDIAPQYRKMLGRGKDSVQGIRALSSDLGVRGSVGLGFIETTSMAEHSVEQREARAADGSKENPNRGPNFDFRTVNVHNATTERMLRGRPLVKGMGFDAKPSPLKAKENPVLSNAFKRSPSVPGFDARSKFGGTRVLPRSRSSIAIPGWAPGELDSEAA